MGICLLGAEAVRIEHTCMCGWGESWSEWLLRTLYMYLFGNRSSLPPFRGRYIASGTYAHKVLSSLRLQLDLLMDSSHFDEQKWAAFDTMGDYSNIKVACCIILPHYCHTGIVICSIL